MAFDIEHFMKLQLLVCSDLIFKYEGNWALWNIIEMLSFGDFMHLYRFFYNRHPDLNAEADLTIYLQPIKYLRNAAAHSNCLLNSIRKPYTRTFTPDKTIGNRVSRIRDIGRASRSTNLRNPIMHDFVVMLYVHRLIVTSKDIKKTREDQIKDFIFRRMPIKKDYFLTNDALMSAYCYCSHASRN